MMYARGPAISNHLADKSVLSKQAFGMNETVRCSSMHNANQHHLHNGDLFNPASELYLVSPLKMGPAPARIPAFCQQSNTLDDHMILNPTKSI